MDSIDRRKFLKKAGRVAGGLGALYLASTLPSCGRGDEGTCPREEGPAAAVEDIPTPAEAAGPQAGLMVVKGKDTAGMLRAGLEAWGGLGILGINGKKVLIKVNAAFARPPEDATTTDPLLVAEMVRLCREAGASKVTVFDHILHDLPDQCLKINGIRSAAESAGAEVVAYGVNKPGQARTVEIPGATALKSAGVLEEVFQSQVLIDMPKAKHHGGARLTLSMKNLIGCLQNMNTVHLVDLHRAIAELNTAIRPALVVMDAGSILLDNGPGGPGRVASPGQVIISRDPVAVDAYASGLFGLSPSDIGYIVRGEELGVGTTDLASLGVKEVEL